MSCATSNCPGEGILRFPLGRGPGRSSPATVTVCLDCFAVMRGRQVLAEALQRDLRPDDIELRLEAIIQQVREEPPPIWAIG